MEIVRKLTIRTCGFTKTAIQAALLAAMPKGAKELPNGTTVALCKMVGVSTGAKTGQSENGTFVKLLGEFHGVNLQDGTMVQSGVCILPNFISETMAAALNVSPQVKFALQIDAVAKSESATGYEFSVKPLIEAAPSNEMLALLKSAGVQAGVPKIGANAAAGEADTDGEDPEGDGEDAAPAPAAKTAGKKK